MSGLACIECCTSRRDTDSARGASSLLGETSSRLRDPVTEVTDSEAGHDCERRSTRVGRISNTGR
jgi:hypothetical protein